MAMHKNIPKTHGVIKSVQRQLKTLIRSKTHTTCKSCKTWTHFVGREWLWWMIHQQFWSASKFTCSRILRCMGIWSPDAPNNWLFFLLRLLLTPESFPLSIVFSVSCIQCSFCENSFENDGGYDASFTRANHECPDACKNLHTNVTLAHTNIYLHKLYATTVCRNCQKATVAQLFLPTTNVHAKGFGQSPQHDL